MKKSFLITLSALIICAFSAVLFASCDKETDSVVIIPKGSVRICVIDEETNRPFQGANVVISNDNKEVSVEELTGMDGRVFATLCTSSEYYDAVATYETNINDNNSGNKYYREGRNSFRLSKGDTIECRIVLLKDLLRH